MSELFSNLGLVVLLSILVSSALAWAWAGNRGWFGYVVSTVCVWAAISAIPLFAPYAETSAVPGVSDQMLAGVISSAPLVLLPMLCLVALVAKGVRTREIVLASTVASILAVPLSFYSALYASCEILHDCP